MNKHGGRRHFCGSLRVRLTLLAALVAAIPLAGAAIAVSLVLRTQLVSDAVNDAMAECVLIESEFRLPPEPATHWVVGDCQSYFPGVGQSLDSARLFDLPKGTTEIRFERKEEISVDSDDRHLSLWPFSDPPASEVVVSRRIVGIPSYAGSSQEFWSPMAKHVLVYYTPWTPTEFVVWSHSLEREQNTLNRVVLWLAGGTFLVIGLIGVTTWVTVGRVIRPVEAIRRSVAEITTHNLSDRVPVPRSKSEIASLAETMNDTLTRLENAVIEQQRFVADASHELRTPIAALRTELEIALAHPGQVHWPRVMASALDDTDRLQQLASDLLLLSHIDVTTPSLDHVVDLNLIAREQGVLRQLPAHLTLRYELHATEVDVECRPVLLGRLVRNLLDNAERYASSSITLVVTTDRSTAVLEVIDDGPGIPPVDRERVFERFARLDHARTRDTGGTGLGLAIARQIATVHHGSLHITDSRQGARFTVRLPLAISAPACSAVP